MNKLTHFKKLRNPNYIGSYELMVDENTSIEKIVTIDKVITELVQNGDKKEMMMVCYFKECKPAILNSTNAKSISKALQSDFIENWQGRQICLFVAKIKAFGEMHDALRIKSVDKVKQLPVLVLNSENFIKCKEAIGTGYTIDQIKAKYTLSKEVENALI
jgi:hypothetical protein